MCCINQLLLGTLLLLLCMSPVLLASSVDSKTQRDLPGSIGSKRGLLNVSIDPRQELLTTIQYLSGSEMVIKDENAYTVAIESWFSAHREHPAIQMLSALESAGYCHDLPVTDFLRFGNISLENREYSWGPTSEDMNNERMDCVAQEVSLDEFYTLVRDFSNVSDFAGFFRSQEVFYRQYISRIIGYLEAYPDLIAHMTDWYGYCHSSYSLVISPLVNGGYGPALTDSAGNIHAYCIARMNRDYSGDEQMMQLSSWLFHEFSHSFVNPLVEKHYEIFRSGEPLYEAIGDKMRTMAYSSWWIAVAEHLVRVNDARLNELFYPSESRVWSPDIEKNRGFIFIDYAHEAILQYEQSKAEQGTTYAEYFPILARSFMAINELSKEEMERLTRFLTTE